MKKLEKECELYDTTTIPNITERLTKGQTQTLIE